MFQSDTSPASAGPGRQPLAPAAAFFPPGPSASRWGCKDRFQNIAIMIHIDSPWFTLFLGMWTAAYQGLDSITTYSQVPLWLADDLWFPMVQFKISRDADLGLHLNVADVLEDTLVAKLCLGDSPGSLFWQVRLPSRTHEFDCCFPQYAREDQSLAWISIRMVYPYWTYMDIRHLDIHFCTGEWLESESETLMGMSSFSSCSRSSLWSL